MKARDRLINLYFLLLWLIPLNVTWVLLTLPVITAFPALLGLVYATNQLVHDVPVSWRNVLVGFRRYFWVSWRWGLLASSVYGLIVFAGWFYSQSSLPLTPLIQGVLTALTLLWTVLQLQMLPLLIEQEQPAVLLALKNSLVLVIVATRRSGQMLFTVLIVTLITVFIIPTAVFFLTPSVLTYVLNHEMALAIRESRP